MKCCEDTRTGLLVSLMDAFHITTLCLFRLSGQVEVMAELPQKEGGGNIPIGTLYRRLQEILGKRIRLYCVRRGKDNCYREREDRAYE